MHTLLQGTLSLPGDKSISHRALMLLGVAKGKATVKNLLTGKDVLSTLNCMRALGCTIEQQDDTTFTVEGTDRLAPPAAMLDCGNSGTTLRLLSALLCGAGVEATLTGDDSLIKRPLNRIIDPLRLMGASIQSVENNGKAPVRIEPAHSGLHGIHYRLPMASAQVKSAVLLAGLYTSREEQVIVEEVIPSRDHTERILTALGCPVGRQESRIILQGRQPDLISRDILVPGDISSAAFWMVGAAICPHSQIVLKRVGINPTRMGILNIMQQTGISVFLQNIAEEAAEPYADMRVEYGPMQGDITIDGNILPTLIDEIPILTIMGLFNDGLFTLQGAEELRVKESDRLGALIGWLRKFGVQVEAYEDGFSFQGDPNWVVPKLESSLPTYHDHRLVMALEILNLRSTYPIPIEGKEWVTISYPSFYQQLDHLKKQTIP